MDPSYEKRLAAVTVGEPEALAGPIEIRDYDRAWPDLYAREAGRICRALGERALRLEHAGSTSVPGLPAKPVIDVVLEVADSADEPSLVPDMEAAGYVLRIREPEWHQHRLFKGPDIDANVHVSPPAVRRPSGCCCSGTGSASALGQIAPEVMATTLLLLP